MSVNLCWSRYALLSGDPISSTSSLHASADEEKRDPWLTACSLIAVCSIHHSHCHHCDSSLGMGTSAIVDPVLYVCMHVLCTSRSIFVYVLRSASIYVTLHLACTCHMHYHSHTLYGHGWWLTKDQNTVESRNCDRLWENLAYGMFCENWVWCMVDKLYHRATPHSSFRLIVRFVVEIVLCLRLRHTPNNWEITVQRHCYARVWRFRILRVNQKSIKSPWAEPFGMNVQIERGSDFVVDNSRRLFFNAQEAKKVSEHTVVR